MTATPDLVATPARPARGRPGTPLTDRRYGAAFADDSDFVTVRGRALRSAQVIAAGHQGIFDSIYRGSTVKLGARPGT